MKSLEARLRITSDRATFCLGYTKALAQMIGLVEQMRNGKIICNVDNLIEFASVSLSNAEIIARMEIRE